MKLSARNQFPGKITAIEEGAVNGIVTIDVQGHLFTSTISMGSIKSLGLEVGGDAIAVVKATEVMIGTGLGSLSARNSFKGKVVNVDKGVVSAIVTLNLGDGLDITSTISLGSAERLGLGKDVEAYAVIKATSVMVGIE